MPAPVIAADDLVKKYKDFAAVDGISFEVAPGESFGLLGRTARASPRPCGWSARSRRARAATSASSVSTPNEHGPEIRSLLGVVPQADNLDTELRVRDNLIVYGRYFGLPRGLRKRADELLAFAQLADKAKARSTTSRAA